MQKSRLAIALTLSLLSCASTTQTPSGSIPPALLPAEFAAVEAPSKHLLRVRLYAGADYRARLEGWREELEAEVASASTLLQGGCRCELKVEDIVIWDRNGGEIGKTLKTLASLDPGRDVDLVIGLIDAPTEVFSDYAQLMRPRVLGRHLVIRSFNGEAEVAMLSLASKLSEDLRAALVGKRRHHKQSLVMAYGISSVFGAPPTTSYQSTDTALERGIAKILRLTVPAHLADDVEAWAKVLPTLETMELPEKLRALARARAGGTSKAQKDESKLRQVDREALDHAQTLLDDKKVEEAWVVIEPLVELHPEESLILDIACVAAHARGATDALVRCQRATAADKNNAETWLRVGGLQIDAEPKQALVSLDRSGRLMTRDAKGWPVLAQGYRRLQMPTRAAHAASKTTLAKSVSTWAETRVLRYGSNVGVNSDDEGDYLQALESALRLVYSSDYPDAAQAADTIHARFSKSIARPLIRCESELRQRNYSMAQASCDQVLLTQPRNTWARYLLGILNARNKRDPKAIAHLQAAINKDPTLRAAYQSLITIYKRLNDQRSGTLRQAYKRRFGAVLK